MGVFLIAYVIMKILILVISNWGERPVLVGIDNSHAFALVEPALYTYVALIPFFTEQYGLKLSISFCVLGLSVWAWDAGYETKTLRNLGKVLSAEIILFFIYWLNTKGLFVENKLILIPCTFFILNSIYWKTKSVQQINNLSFKSLFDRRS